MFIEILPEVWVRCRDVRSIVCTGSFVFVRSYPNTNSLRSLDFGSDISAFTWAKRLRQRMDEMTLRFPKFVE